MGVLPKALLAIVAFCLPFSVIAADTVYVNDMLRVGVRTDPASNEAPIAVVTTGTALSVLERQGNYLKVRTEDGTEGWVNSVYTSEQKPARMRLAQLQKAYAQNQEQLQSLQAKLSADETRVKQLQQALTDAHQEKQQLKGQLGQLKSRLGESQWAWLASAVAFILLFVGGIFLGSTWRRQRISDRLGGMDI